MKVLLNFIKVAILFRVTFGTEVGTGNGTEQSKTNSSNIEVDNRINLNFNHAGAAAHNKHGGSSVSHSSSVGFNAALLYNDGYLESLGSHSGSSANSFATGANAPGTFAETGSGSTKQGIKGSAGAGYSGNKGNAWSTSNSDHLEVKLGENGPLLLSNIQHIDKSAPGNTNAGAASSNPHSKLPYSDRIVFDE